METKIKNRTIEKAPVKKEENFGDDFTDVEYPRKIFRFDQISAREKLRFAKMILLFSFVLFIIVLSVYMLFPESPRAEKIWSFASVAINSIVAILIGHYFATNQSNS